MELYEAAYIKTYRSGELIQKIEKARQLLSPCTVCPRKCGIDRLNGETGVCMTGKSAMVCSFHAHFGEEAPLVGTRGSGTIFFTYCNLLCSFCQNFEISHEGEGQIVRDRQIAQMMLMLQKEGCHNINLVTPSHVVPQILAALPYAIEGGLSVPLVYNTGAYDRLETLKLLEGVFDIYMPDFKFMDAEIAEITCMAGDYSIIAKSALKEMHRQVGDLVMDESGIAKRGLLLRHLVLPENLAGTKEVMRFIAGEISPDTYVNIMPQYRPCGNAHKTSGLRRRITEKEFEAAMDAAKDAGILRFDTRKRTFVI
ncbi:MAG: radical SAM protein [Desulfobacterales bacterium]